MIDIRREFGKRAFEFGVRRFFWEKKDEYGVYRARGEDGDIINVSEEEIRKLRYRASMMERSCLCLPEHAEQFAKGDPVSKTYTEAEVKYMINDRIGNYNWEIGGLRRQLEDTTSSLQSDINWYQKANELVHKKKDIRL